MPCNSTNTWKAFSASRWLWKHFSCKMMLEEIIVSWWEGRWIWQMRQNFIAQQKNWTISVNQFQLQALQFSVPLIDLLSILLRCNDYAMIQKAVADQTSRRLSNRDHKLFWVQVWLWEVFWRFFLVQHWAGHCQLPYKIHFSLHVIIGSKNGLLLYKKRRLHFKMIFFFDFW